MPERLRLLLGFACLAIVLGSGVVMTIFTLRQASAQISSADFDRLRETVNQLVAAVPTTAITTTTTSDSTASPSTESSGRVVINRATLAELDKLPGIGQVRAQALLDARATGPFIDLDDIRARVPKVPASVLADIAPLITFEE